MEPNSKPLCLYILGFKKPGMSTDEYRSYMVHVHAPLVANLMKKYGFIHWSMTHTSDESRQLMGQLHDAQFSNIAPYDCCVQLVFPNIESFVRFKADSFFKEIVGPDHDKFADTKRSQMMMGDFSPLMVDGNLVNSK